MPPRPGSNIHLESVSPLPVIPPATNSLLPVATHGNRTWNYNAEGVAHYGLLPDYPR